MRLSGILLIVLLGSFVLTFSQSPQEVVPLQIGIGLSANAYTGDLNYRDNRPIRAYPGINFSLQFDNKKPLGFQVNTGYARFTEQKDELGLQGQGEYRPNIYVQTSFFYLDIRLRYFFYHNKNVRPFVASGIGFLSFNPEDINGDFLTENIFSRLPEEETYLTLVAQLPIQVGVQVKIKPSVSLNISGLYRFTTTDYLDNIGLFGSKPGKDALFAAQAELAFSLVSADTPKAQEPKAAQVKPVLLTQEEIDFLMYWEDVVPKFPSKENRVEPVDYP